MSQVEHVDGDGKQGLTDLRAAHCRAQDQARDEYLAREIAAGRGDVSPSGAETCEGVNGKDCRATLHAANRCGLCIDCQAAAGLLSSQKATRHGVRVRSAMASDGMLSAVQAAKLLGVSGETIKALLDANRFPGAHRHNPYLKQSPWRIPKQDVDALLKQGDR